MDSIAKRKKKTHIEEERHLKNVGNELNVKKHSIEI